MHVTPLKTRNGRRVKLRRHPNSNKLLMTRHFAKHLQLCRKARKNNLRNSNEKDLRVLLVKRKK